MAAFIRGMQSSHPKWEENIVKRRRKLLALQMLTILLGPLVTAPAVAANKEQILYNFCSDYGCYDGLQPWAGMTFDAKGNLYGTASFGGACGPGMVFELSRTKRGVWKEKVLHSFGCNDVDGNEPWAGVIFDGSGNLYGTTLYGGAYYNGAVFELTPERNGTWTETILHSFKLSTEDGGSPIGGLVRDKSGNIYGTTSAGGANWNCDLGCGVVFELSLGANRVWTEKVLHSFNGSDGDYPTAELLFDQNGHLYGTTEFGGLDGYGTVFELTQAKKGMWVEKVLHDFHGADGKWCWGGLVADAEGNLYGTTIWGGSYDYGALFELSRSNNGTWTEKLLHSFNYNGKDGALPRAGLVFDALGRLYGTTEAGGAYSSSCWIKQGCGTVYELNPSKNHRWTEKVLHSFANDGTDGFQPQSTLILDRSGRLYGITVLGGAGPKCNGGGYGCGTAFEVTP
jgi:uncharacterized repeat protein (TIGR03803 family)